MSAFRSEAHTNRRRYLLFFQAEDGIRDIGVTGVQTCALPIYPDSPREVAEAYAPYLIIIVVFALAQLGPIKDALDSVTQEFDWPGLDIATPDEIGRASCRERV